MRYIMIFILWFVSACCFAQHEANANASTVQDRLNNKLQEALSRSDFDKALILADSIETFGRKERDTAFLVYAFQIRSEIYKFKSDLPRAKRNLRKMIEIHNSLKDSARMIRSNSAMSSLYRVQGKLDSSILELNNVRHLVDGNSDSTAVQYYYNQRSSVLETMGQLDSAIFYVFKRIDITSEQNYYGKAIAFLQLASLFYKVQDYDKSLDYVNKSIVEIHLSKTPLPSTRLKANVAKSELLLLLDRNAAAKKAAKETLELIKIDEHLDYKAKLEIILSQIKFNEGVNNLISEEYIKDKKISKETLLRYYTLLIMQAERLKDFKLAEDAINKSDPLSDNVGNLISKRHYFNEVSKYWKNRGEYHRSLMAQSRFLEIDSQINDHTQNYITYELENKYQLQKKEIQLKLQQSEIEKKTITSKMALALAFMFFAAGIGIILFFKERQRKKDEQLRSIKKEAQINTLESLIAGEEKERMRIAQELHDGLNGDLSAIKYKLNSINQVNTKGVQEVVAMIDKSCEQVRAISHNLIPPALEKFDLYLATSDYCQKMNLNYEQEVDFEYFGVRQTLPKNLEINMYRIVQELVTNSLRHSKASTIHVQLSSIDDVIQLTVEDNGSGFDTNAIAGIGIGLRNIKSRVEYLNGELDMVSNSKGTSVSVSVSNIDFND